MKMIKYLLALFFFSNSVFADDGEIILKALQNKFETINDLTVNVNQKSASKEVLSGKLSYKKENKFILDLKNNLITSDGRTIWNYNKRENKIIINNVDESDPSFFSFRSIVYEYPSKCELATEQNGEILVIIPKKNSDLNFSKAKMWIENDLPVKIIFEGTGVSNTEISFSNYKLNQNLSDSKFSFAPPEGSTVIDLR